MAWYNPGGGAGVWQDAIINPSLKNIIAQLCYAVNERQAAIARNRVAITSITRSGSTATVTTTGVHGITDQDVIYIRGADQANYNGVQTATVTSTTVFTFPVDSGTTTPATGTMYVYKPTKFTYNASGSQKAYPAASDFVGYPISQTTPPVPMVIGKVISAATSITRSGSTATVTTTAAHGLQTGDQVEISGVTQTDYNGTFTVTVTGTTTFTYAVANAPTTPATGTAVILQSGITRASAVATVRCIGHGLLIGNYVNISGATQSEYNGWQAVTGYHSVPSVSSITRASTTATVTTSGAHGLKPNDLVRVHDAGEAAYNGLKTVTDAPTSTTFTYTVSGSPSTPASGTPAVEDLSRFTFAVSGSPLSPGTGAATATPHRHMIYFAQHDGTNGEFYSKAHDFAVNDRLSIYQHGGSGYTEWEVDGLVNAVSGDKFEIVMAAPSPSDEVVESHLYAAKNVGIGVVLRELQVAIESIATASGSAKYVVDSAPYETAYTISSLLTAGSYGSTWLSLYRLSRGDLVNVLLQMREALDLLTTVRATLSQVSADAEFILGDGTGSGIGVGPQPHPGYDLRIEYAWDQMLADTPASTSAGYIGILFEHRTTFVFNDWWNCVIDDHLELTINQQAGLGTFVECDVVMLESHTANSTNPEEVDEFDVICDITTPATLTLNAAASDSQAHTVALVDADAASGHVFTLPFHIYDTLPTDVPADAMGVLTENTGGTDGAVTSRRMQFSSGHTVRELVPGTHLTYG